MADNAKTLEITLLGRVYRVACEPGEREALLKAVSYVDDKMADIKKASRNATTERVAVMAALNIAHELLSTRVGDGVDVGEAKRRIASIAAKLEEAIGQQEKLF